MAMIRSNICRMTLMDTNPHHNRTPAILARELRLLDPLQLPLAPDVVLERRDRAQHRQHEPPRAGVGIDPALVEAAERHALAGQRLDDPVKIADAAGKPVEAAHDQRVVLANEVERLGELLTTRC